MNLTALQVKTSYSILKSLNDINKLVLLAEEYGYTSLAITDECNMFGVIKFYQECIKKNIKPIIGLELIINDCHILLYAKNINGYKNLIKLSTIISDREITMDDLNMYRDNLILVMPFSFFDEKIYNIYEDKFVGYDNFDGVNDLYPKVFINDVSYLYKDDHVYLDYASMIREGKILGEYVLNNNKGKYLLNKDEYALKVKDDVLKNMEYIVSNCNLELGYTEGLLPIYKEGINSREYLRELSFKGLNKRLNGNVSDKYNDRLLYELDTIDKMGFNDYFLIVYDYVLYAKKNGILVGPGRGSAVGSLVSYTLGITDVDPLEYNLLFERFLNIERVSMPDIDIDFDASKRGQVIEYVISKYGAKKVAGIITFNTLGAKQVIRDVGRVLNIKQSTIDNLAKQSLDDLKESYEKKISFRKLVDNFDELKKLYKIALHLEGLPRHVSVHAAGIVMSKYDIDDTIPLYKNQLGMYVSAYSKDYLEQLGLLKMDFLGISNLTLIDEVIKNIRDDTHMNITFSNIPMNDSKTISLFANGDTEGIFQFEAPGMMKFLKKLKARNFNDIVVATSLYRPGPMDSIPEYLGRREGKIKIDYIDDSLKDILEETYGIIIYQEQVMKIAEKMAGYTLGEADILRSAMSKKKESILLKEKEKFINGSINNGYDKELANKVYNTILKFAGYGFNKSHAVVYSLIAYRMAFLKVHFYNYFMLSVLNNAINNEEKTSGYISQLRSKSVLVMNPDINMSLLKYTIYDKKIICPLSIIRNVGNNIASIIINEREKGEYVSFTDFVTRMYNNKSVNRKVLESLILSGAFSSFGYNKRTLMLNLDNIINYAELVSDSTLIEIDEPLIDIASEYSKEELVKMEFDVFGFYLSMHPVSRYRSSNKMTTLLIEDNVNRYISIVLEIINVREVITKKNDVMAFVYAGDEYRQVELTIFPDVYKEYNRIKKHDIVCVYGKVEKRLDNYQIVVSKLKVLSEE